MAPLSLSLDLTFTFELLLQMETFYLMVVRCQGIITRIVMAPSRLPIYHENCLAWKGYARHGCRGLRDATDSIDIF